MANVQLPTFDEGEKDLSKMVKQLINVYIMLTEELTFLLNNLDTRNVNYLSADVIDAGTINAGLVTITSALMNGGHITIDANGMVVNDGTRDTFKVGLDGKVRMTGAVIESKQEYPKVVMDPDTELFAAYKSALSYVRMMLTTSIASSPGIEWKSPITSFGAALDGDTMKFTGGNLALEAVSSLLSMSANRIIMNTFDGIYITGWSQLRTNSGGSAATDFASKGASTEPSLAFNGGIPIGTKLMTEGGGTVTWQGMPAHSHTQR